MNKSVLERAFELASYGKCEDTTAIRKALTREAYDDAQIEGRVLIRQLDALLTKAHPEREPHPHHKGPNSGFTDAGSSGA